MLEDVEIMLHFIHFIQTAQSEQKRQTAQSIQQHPNRFHRHRTQVIRAGDRSAGRLQRAPSFPLDTNFAQCEVSSCGSSAERRLEKRPPSTANACIPQRMVQDNEERGLEKLC